MFSIIHQLGTPEPYDLLIDEYIYTDDACYRYHKERAMIQLRHFISVLGSRPSAYVTGAVERTVLREQSPMRLIHIAMKVLLHIMLDHLNFNLHSYVQN